MDTEYHGVPNEPEAPAEEPAEETAEQQNPDAVNEAMAQLYPEATDKAEQPAEATYTRRRRTDAE